MTMIPCPKCEKHLIHDEDDMCPDCKATAAAFRQEKKSMLVRKMKALAMLAMDMSKALAPIFKPVFNRMLANPIMTLLVLFLGGVVLSGLIQNTAPARSKPPVPSTAPAAAPSAPKEPVVNSGWDGSVWQVEHYLERNLKDPDSFEAIDWFTVVKNNDNNTYLVRCRYRAKNSFGGFVIEDRLFQLNKNGDVIAAVDYDPLGARP